MMLKSSPRSEGQIDWLLLATIMLLICLGLTMVLSSSGVVAAKKYGDQYYFFKRQVIFAAVGIVAMLVALKIPREFLYNLKYPILLGVILLLLRKKGRKDYIPFGPFMAAALFISVLYGQEIIDWYISTMW